MPGAFLVQGERVLWEHDFAHVGDAPDWNRLPAIVKQTACLPNGRVGRYGAANMTVTFGEI